MRGTVRYEVTMAFRGRTPWLALLPLCVVALLIGLGSPALTGYDNPVARIGATASMVTVIGSIGVAVALADRLSAQQRTGLHELIAATPMVAATRMVWVLLGPWLVAMVPVAVVVLAIGARIAGAEGSVRPLPAALATLLTMVVPGSLLLTAVANLLSLLVPVAAARVLVVPFWYWATALSPLIRVPTLTGTVLSPGGAQQAAAWFGTRLPGAGRDWLHPAPTSASALLSIGSTLAAALLIFLLSLAVRAARLRTEARR
jgi:ABC-2 type transport system permease protein